jgi:hypothetical protein
VRGNYLVKIVRSLQQENNHLKERMSNELESLRNERNLLLGENIDHLSLKELEKLIAKTKETTNKIEKIIIQVRKLKSLQIVKC